MFLLGVVVILDALADGEHLGQLLVGALLLGIVPVDEALGALTRRR